MIEAFKSSPVLLLFVVSAIGYWIGNIPIRGAKLGVAAVLFAGLAVGAIDPGLAVPDIIIVLGLSMFVYTIGLSSGPSFFSTFRAQGLRNFAFIIVMLGLSALITIGMYFLFDLDAATAAGLLAGSSTNTASLAGLLDLIQLSQPAELQEAMSNAAVVGYSLSYPMGVLGVMFAINIMQKWLNIDYKQEAAQQAGDLFTSEDITRRTIVITNPEMEGKTIRAIFQHFQHRLVFGRMQRSGIDELPNMDTRLQLGDRIVLVGNAKTIDEAIVLLGRADVKELSYDRSSYDVRRLFVSNPNIAGEKIASLNLTEKFSTIITRVQRGDVDLLANGNTVLELGDRVLLVARRTDFDELKKLFGNSYEALNHINLLSFGSGMALGLLLGMVTFTLPGGVSFNLGFAGGPLIVALILGALRRTGPIVWTLPFGANLVLRQLGLILLLASIGIRSGHTFLNTILAGGGGWLFLAGTIIATGTAFLTLWLGYRWLRIPFGLLTGMVATQPAILEHALHQADNKLPTLGYTLILPIVLITKILFVQLLFAFLS
ncbi:aspartate:alanine exchanger family transporter [Lewinella cohaerens]|uniref:aspartate:alanine exchanger family transporter n=1 Tax=Lewinella cohaerens TaxID=70995 RepID=UPI000364FA4E|nr:TrkA C-terminal domain-containing protein [Lewinella cohaerens]